MNTQKKLQDFTRKLKKYPEISAVYYTGSTATKKWDRYSDIDLDIVIKDKDYNKFIKQLPEILSLWGDKELKLVNNYPSLNETYAFFGKDYEKVEIDPIKESRLKPHPKLKNIRIGFDKTNKIKGLISRSKELKEEPKIDHKEFENILLDTRANFLYLVRHFARGQKLSAVSGFSGIWEDLFYLLSKLKELQNYELLRDAEKTLSKKELNMIRIFPKGTTKTEIRNAIKNYWEFMKYIEEQYQKIKGTPLDLQCNDNEIFENINKTIKESK